MKRAVLGIVQAALDRALRLDPQAAAILAPLCGKRVAVQIVGVVPAQLCIEIRADRILVEDIEEPLDDAPAAMRRPGARSTPAGTNADVSIRGSASALAMLARGTDELPSSAQVSVHGDIAVLQMLRGAIGRLRPDFDEPLARLLGDEIAYPLSRGLRLLAATARRSVRELGDDVKEYLGEESQLLADRDAVRDFSNEVDRLRDAHARLEKRVARLANRLDRPTR